MRDRLHSQRCMLLGLSAALLVALSAPAAAQPRVTLDLLPDPGPGMAHDPVARLRHAPPATLDAPPAALDAARPRTRLTLAAGGWLRAAFDGARDGQIAAPEATLRFVHRDAPARWIDARSVVTLPIVRGATPEVDLGADAYALRGVHTVDAFWVIGDGFGAELGLDAGLEHDGQGPGFWRPLMIGPSPYVLLEADASIGLRITQDAHSANVFPRILARARRLDHTDGLAVTRALSEVGGGAGMYGWRYEEGSVGVRVDGLNALFTSRSYEGGTRATLETVQLDVVDVEARLSAAGVALLLAGRHGARVLTHGGGGSFPILIDSEARLALDFIDLGLGAAIRQRPELTADADTIASVMRVEGTARAGATDAQLHGVVRGVFERVRGVEPWGEAWRVATSAELIGAPLADWTVHALYLFGHGPTPARSAWSPWTTAPRAFHEVSLGLRWRHELL